MQPVEPYYSVTLETRIPDFEAERRFVATEREHAKRKLAESRERRGLLAGVASLLEGKPDADQWKKYARALDRYADQIDRHEEVLAGGLVPVKLFVANESDQTDSGVEIRVEVEHGAIHPEHKAPVRPEPVDDPDEPPAHSPKRAVLEPVPAAAKASTVMSGFKRTGVRISAHHVEAVFSRLAAEDSADLVHQVLYLESGPETRLRFEIRSRRRPEPQRGEVQV